MNKARTTWMALCLMVLGALNAQIEYGGEPIEWASRSSYDDIPALRMSGVDVAALRAEDAVTDQYSESPYRFGVSHDVNIQFLSEAQYSISGEREVWRLGIKCPGALSVSLFFEEYLLSADAELHVYNVDKSDRKGAFTMNNNKDNGALPIGLVEGEQIIIEYSAPIGTKHPKLRLSEVIHGYRPILNKWEENRGPFGNSGACNINVNCPEGAAWQDQKRSVGLIVQSGFAVCTGSLVNNTAEDGTPYFLTANHCLGNPGSWTYYFNHESSTCGGSTGPTNQSISGGTLRASSAESDMALIQLSSTPPSSYGVFYNGWDATDAENASSAVGIHHPSGDVKKICFEEDAPFHDVLSFNGNSDTRMWYINQWEDGVTEPGSSGSPLYNQAGRVIGMLSGGAAACSGGQNNGLFDYYGRFGVGWDLENANNSQLENWLDPTGSGIEILDGFDPSGAGGATCDDGVQNGAETGVDCGGPLCPPCPCLGDTYTLTIELDNYPEETSWTVTSNGSTVASGGTYANQADGSVVTEDICLEDGCYEFNIFDSFGDGLCCEFGIGAYTLTSPGGEVLASGAEFLDSESTSFCTDEEPLICSQENFVDAPTGQLVSFDGELLLSWDAYGASTACQIQAGLASASGVSSFIVGDLNGNESPSERSFPLGAVTPGETYRWRVRCGCNDGSMTIGSPFTAYQNFTVPLNIQSDPSVDLFKSQESISVTSLFPNPSDGVVTLELEYADLSTLSYVIYDLAGRSVMEDRLMTLQGFNRYELQLSDLDAGTYILSLRSGQNIVQERFIIK